MELALLKIDGICHRIELQVTESDDRMLEMVQRDEAVLGINSFVMTSQRLQAVDFTGATWKLRSQQTLRQMSLSALAHSNFLFYFAGATAC